MQNAIFVDIVPVPVKRRGTLETVDRCRWPSLLARQVRLRDGSRMRGEVPAAKKYDDKAARNFVEWAQEKEDREGTLFAAKLAGQEKRVKPNASAEDDGDRWFDAWIGARKAEGITTTYDNERHYRLHIRPAMNGSTFVIGPPSTCGCS